MDAGSNYTCPNCNAKLLVKRRREAAKLLERAFCPYCIRLLPVRDGADTLDYELVEAPVAFKLIGSTEEPNGMLRLIYGVAHDDPQPFILTLTPQHVVHATGKTPPIMLQDIQEYVKRNADRLKAIAKNARERGLTAQVLE